MKNTVIKSSAMKKAIAITLAFFVAVSVMAGILVTPAQAKTTLPGAEDQKTFTAMMYNVQAESAVVNENAKPSAQQAFIRAIHQANMVNTYAPDIFGTTEETETFQRTFQSYLSNYGSVGDFLFKPASLRGPIFNDAEVSDSNRIYYNKDKFEHISSKTIWLYNGNVNIEGKLPGETKTRGATLALLKLKSTGEKVVVASANLSTNKALASTQANILTTQVELFAARNGATATLYMGTLNTNSGEQAAFNGWQSVWDSSVKSYTVGGETNSSDNMYVNTGAKIANRMELTGQEWEYANTASTHHAVMARVHFSSYTPKSSILETKETNVAVAEQLVKVQKVDNQLVVNSSMDGLTQGDNFLMYYDANGKYIGGQQLWATKVNGQWVIDNAKVNFPTKTAKVNFAVWNGNQRTITLENVWTTA